MSLREELSAIGSPLVLVNEMRTDSREQATRWLAERGRCILVSAVDAWATDRSFLRRKGGCKYQIHSRQLFLREKERERELCLHLAAVKNCLSRGCILNLQKQRNPFLLHLIPSNEIRA